MVHRLSAAELLLNISRCVEVSQCLHGDESHPCYEVVRFAQSRRSTRDDFHQPAPEPWIGHLERAPLLFIGPNPGGQPVAEQLPVGFAHLGAEEAVIRRSTENAFDKSSEWPRFDDASHWRTSADSVAYLTHYGFIFRRASELIVDAEPGIDYAVTDIVKCGSAKQTGVNEGSVSRCSSLYLDQVLTLSGASVLITLGIIARETIKKRYGLTGDFVAGPSSIEGRDRYVLFLSHPRQPVRRQRIAERLTTDQLRGVLDFLRSRQFVREPKDLPFESTPPEGLLD